MMTTSWDFARLLEMVTKVKENKAINDNDRIALLREMQAQLPPEKMSISANNSRLIVDRIIQEMLDGYQAQKTTAKKPKSSGKRTSSVESPKKELLLNPNGNTRGKRTAKTMVN